MSRRLGIAFVALTITGAVAVGCSSTPTSTTSSTGGGSSSTTAAANSTSAASSGTAGPSAPGSTSAPSTSSGSSSSPGGAPPPSAPAQNGLLPVSALPGSGWTGSSTTPPGGSGQSTAQQMLNIPACQSLMNATGATASATSKASATFHQGTGLQGVSLDNEVDIYPGPEGAKAFVLILQNDQVDQCMSAYIQQSSSGANFTVSGPITIANLAVPSASEVGVDSISGIVINVPITTADGSTAVLQAQVVAMQKGNASGSITATTASEAANNRPPVDIGDIAKAAGARLAAVSG